MIRCAHDAEAFADIIGEGRELISRGHKHYTVNSGQHLTADEAAKAFWDCYDSHQPIADGGIQWRLIPTLRTYQSAGTQYFQWLARFSIA